MNDRKTRAFTLIEIVAALVLVGLLGSGFVSAWGVVVKQTAQPAQLAQMQDLAATSLDQWLNTTPYSTLSGKVGTSQPLPLATPWSGTVSFRSVSNGGYTGVRITATVQCNSNVCGQNQKVSLTGDTFNVQ